MVIERQQTVEQAIESLARVVRDIHPNSNLSKDERGERFNAGCIALATLKREEEKSAK